MVTTRLFTVIALLIVMMCSELAHAQLKNKNSNKRRPVGKGSGGMSAWELERLVKVKAKKEGGGRKVTLFQKDVGEEVEGEVKHPQFEKVKQGEGLSVSSTDGTTLPQRKLMEVPVSPGSTTTVFTWVKVDSAGEPILS